MYNLFHFFKSAVAFFFFFSRKKMSTLYNTVSAVLLLVCLRARARDCRTLSFSDVLHVYIYIFFSTCIPVAYVCLEREKKKKQ